MPPKKAATTKAAAPKAAATKKAPATTKKAAAADKSPPAKKDTKAATATKPATEKTATKATVNGETTKAPASKKRKAEETESDEEDEQAEVPMVKRPKTTASAVPAKKAAVKKATEKKTETNGTASKAKATAAKKASPAAIKDTKSAPAKKRKTDEDAAVPDAKPTVKKAKSVSPDADSQATISAPPEDAQAPSKATKPKAAPKPTVIKKSAEIGKKINEVPTQILDVYVFGEGSNGELGLGSRKVDGKKPLDVKRPRLNNNLSAKTVGVVQVSCGGMHAAAMTKDNKILTWGVNDQGALGRDTKWDGGLRDMDKESDDSDDDDDDSGLNPMESTPTAIDDKDIVPGTKFVQVVASDSATFALTEDGRVYGWGTFRSSDGILGFSESVKVQTTPIVVPGLKNIKALAAGSNHVLSLDNKGAVLAWGCGQQNQLGRRIIERNKLSSLVPQGMGLPKNKIVKIACGSYHSFALDKAGQVYSWGLNNFAETGVEEGAGDDDAAILRPTIIKSLKPYKITDIAGGEHHSIACSDDGKLLAWGRVDGHQVGIPVEDLAEENMIFDERKSPRILFKPTVVEDVPKVVSVAAGTDNSFAITADGQAYSWGFSSNYQTGLGTMEDVEEPTLIENTAVKGKKLVHAGAGGQYSILCGIPESAPKTNGVQVNGTALEAGANKENEGGKAGI